MRKIYVYLAICAAFCACGDNPTLDIAGMFSPQGPTIKTRFDHSMAYNDKVGEIHLDMQQDDYVVYTCADSHINKAHRNLAYFVNQYEAETSPKIAIHLGDLIDAQYNFAEADSVLHLGGRSSNDTLFITPGNHDIYFYQWDIYRSYYHTSVYWFDTNNGSKKLDLFICLDSADGELGNKQVNWLKDLLAEKADDGYRHIIAFTHTHMWKLDMSQGHTSNYAIESTYELTSILGQYGVDYVWSGHQHSRQLVEYNGVTYMAIDATKDQESNQAYMIANIGDRITYDYPDYPKVSE